VAHRALSAFAIAVLSGTLAACGGGGSTNTVIVQPNPPPAGSIAIAPSSLTFGAPGAAPQSFTITSTAGAVAAPAFDNLGCAPVATISPPSSPTLPATYSVTPTGVGTCSFVARLGTATATIGINVGATAPTTTTNASSVVLYAGGTSGTIFTGSSSGSFTADGTACNGIATVTGPNAVAGNPTYNQSFTIAPGSPGTCQIALVNGSASAIVTVTVNPSPSGPAALQISPSSLDFASPSAPPQHATITFTGSVGQVSFDESDCTGGPGGTTKPKIAFFTLDNVPPGTPVSLPASITVTPYGTASGTCVIHFTPQNGTGADLTVTVH
jgi:hypothetical protein